MYVEVNIYGPDFISCDKHSGANMVSCDILMCAILFCVFLYSRDGSVKRRKAAIYILTYIRNI
jgi:hypothetical protein